MNKIELLNNSSWKGHFIEVGAGMPVSEMILKEEHASKTILSAYSPYSKESLYDFIHREISRSVSESTILALLSTKLLKLNEFTFASSFQIGHGKCNHGWIGFKGYFATKGYVCKLYHVSLKNKTEKQSRKAVIEHLGKLGLDLLLYSIGLGEIPLNSEVDITPMDENEVLNFGCNVPVVYTSFGVQRLETLRDIKNLCIYKGSFNPPHKGHEFTCNEMQKKMPVVLSMSVDTFGKSTMDSKETLRRIEMLNSKFPGIPIILYKSGFFRDIIKILEYRLPKVKLNFALGWDTYIRLESSVVNNNKHVDFYVFDREHKIFFDNYEVPLNVKLQEAPEETQNISSTQIRNEQKKKFLDKK